MTQRQRSDSTWVRRTTLADVGQQTAELMRLGREMLAAPAKTEDGILLIMRAMRDEWRPEDGKVDADGFWR